MLCIKCKKADTKVVDSRDDEKTIRRRRECLSCGFRFTTYEKSEIPNFKVKKRNDEIELYDRLKIYRGITKSLEKRPFSEEKIGLMVDDIEQKIIALRQSIVESRLIGKIVSQRLKNIDEVAYLRFISVYKSFSSAKSFAKEAKKLVSDKSKNNWEE
jgi:transcriptional repressor NrdR